MYYDGRKSISESERNSNAKSIFKDYFKKDKAISLENKRLIFCSDSYHSLSYILTNPLIILQTDTLKVVDKFKLNDNIRINKETNILSFY